MYCLVLRLILTILTILTAIFSSINRPAHAVRCALLSALLSARVYWVHFFFFFGCLFILFLVWGGVPGVRFRLAEDDVLWHHIARCFLTWA